MSAKRRGSLTDPTGQQHVDDMSPNITSDKEEGIQSPALRNGERDHRLEDYKYCESSHQAEPKLNIKLIRLREKGDSRV